MKLSIFSLIYFKGFMAGQLSLILLHVLLWLISVRHIPLNELINVFLIYGVILLVGALALFVPAIWIVKWFQAAQVHWIWYGLFGGLTSLIPITLFLGLIFSESLTAELWEIVGVIFLCLPGIIACLVMGSVIGLLTKQHLSIYKHLKLPN